MFSDNIQDVNFMFNWTVFFSICVVFFLFAMHVLKIKKNHHHFYIIGTLISDKTNLQHPWLFVLS